VSWSSSLRTPQWLAPDDRLGEIRAADGGKLVTRADEARHPGDEFKFVARETASWRTMNRDE